MSTQPNHFAPLARLLHWLMALMIIAMLFIGAGMVASVSERHEWLIHLHKPLGVAILLLVIVRLAVRFSTRQPPLPADLPGWQVLAAKASHVLAVRLDADLAAAGLGDDFGVGRPGDAQQFVAIAIDRAGECAGVCVPAQGAWVSGVSAVSDRVAASGGGVVSWLGAAR